MGNKATKSSIRNAIVYLNISADPIGANDDKFWNQIFSEDMSLADEVIKNITIQEIRILRDGSPRNFATLAYKMVERLCLATGTLCNTQSQQTAVINAIRILIRMIPCIYEDQAWRNYFSDNHLNPTEGSAGQLNLRYPEKKESERNYISYLPQKPGSRSATPLDLTEEFRRDKNADHRTLNSSNQLLTTSLEDIVRAEPMTDCNPSREEESLMHSLISSICDLLFCPEFTVLSHGYGYLSNSVDTPPEDLKSLSTHDYVWEPGVGFESSVNSTTYYDKNRSDLLRALLVCFSVTLYQTPEESISFRNEWIRLFASKQNRHALPIFTSLLNLIFGYEPARPLLQLNNFRFDASRERLVELSAQIMIAVLDYQEVSEQSDGTPYENLFIDYLSRIHRDEDLIFMSKGFTRLFGYGLQQQGYFWSSVKAIDLIQELQLLFWKTCNLNKKFIQFLLQSNDIQDIVVPILYNLNENFQEPSKTALIHIGVFNMLILSSERNFGVRLNKPYAGSALGNLPEFTGTHLDLMIIVFHKLIMYGYKINQLYDYLLTILVNVSPYIKGMTMLSSKCLIQLFETFSSVLVIFTEPNYHQLVVFLLEIFNNILQYQFDGNSNLVYVLLQKKNLFVNLANLPTTQKSIDKVLRKLTKRKQQVKRLENELSTQKGIDSLEETDLTNVQSNNSFEDDLNSALATVSCNNRPNSEADSSKQEVSLVATPTLSRITQPTYPFDKVSDGDKTASPQATSPSMVTKISLDDILNDKEMNSLMSTQSLEDIREQCNTMTETTDNDPIAITNSSDMCLADPPTTIQDKAGCQRKRWKPTSGWLEEWKKSLPLQTVIRMIAALDPQIDQMKRTNSRSVEQSEILKFLQNGTLVGLLPVPHPILIRKYRTNNSSIIWFRTCSWGIIYVRTTIWTGTDIKLIKVL